MGFGQVSLCNDDSSDGGIQICKSYKGYERGAPSEPFPSHVEQIITIHDIPEINLKDRSVTLFMQVLVRWNDNRIAIMPKSNNSEE